jgi:hypothetical protein
MKGLAFSAMTGIASLMGYAKISQLNCRMCVTHHPREDPNEPGVGQVF